MLWTLTLVGLLAAPQPPAEHQQGWVVEIRGYTYPRLDRLNKLVLELRRGPNPQQQKTPATVGPLEWQCPPEQRLPDVIEPQYSDDLSAWFKQSKEQVQVDPVEAFYVDDLSVLFKRSHKH